MADVSYSDATNPRLKIDVSTTPGNDEVCFYARESLSRGEDEIEIFLDRHAVRALAGQLTEWLKEKKKTGKPAGSAFDAGS